MMLIGQYDSPFVRRVGIALHLLGMPVDHRPWASFGDADLIAPFNPLRRVPTLVLDDGEVLIETFAILDHLDEVAGPERAMLPASGQERRGALKIVSLATGLADKANALVYEAVLHEGSSARWVERCRAQIRDTLAALEPIRAGVATRYLFGERIGHADVAVACGLRFLAEAHPDLDALAAHPALTAHAADCERLSAFQAVQQSLIRPT